MKRGYLSPNESNKRKRYKKGDRVGIVNGDWTKYGKIHFVIECRPLEYMIKHYDGIFRYSEEELIVPSNWWLLENNCKRSIYILGICLKRLGFYKDLRILICKHVWATKCDEEWGVYSSLIKTSKS
jgi:hypothetical protein